jgi:hypothetical protein
MESGPEAVLAFDVHEHEKPARLYFERVAHTLLSCARIPRYESLFAGRKCSHKPSGDSATQFNVMSVPFN